MSERDFLLEELDKLTGSSTEDTKQEEPETVEDSQTESVEDTYAETQSNSEDTSTESVEENIQEQEEDNKPKKVEVDYKSFLEENKDIFLTYLKEKNTDYSSLKPEEVVYLKLKNENPEFSEEDLKEELADKYGIGLSKIEIDKDIMTDDEIKEAESYNKSIDKKLRALKKDAPSAVQYFNSLKESLELPKFEMEFSEDEKINPEDFIKNYENENLVKVQEHKEKVWKPQLKEVLDSFESVKEVVEFDDNGSKVAINVDYKLSKDDKEELFNYLSEYLGHPSDSKYVDASNNPDLQRFVEDKAKEISFKKLLKTVAKEASAKAREEFVKNNLVNYSEEARNVTTPNTDDDSLESFLLNRKRR